MLGAVLIAFVAGLMAGSFVTAVAHRVPRGMSIVLSRSECPACGAQIAAYDNVPVFSWLLLRGRARCCGARISPRYPLTELGVALLFVATMLVYRHGRRKRRSAASSSRCWRRSRSPTSSGG